MYVMPEGCLKQRSVEAIENSSASPRAKVKARYYIETYGCALSEFDSLVMTRLLDDAGYLRVSRPEDADVIIVNTCAVRLDTEQRISERLRELRLKLPDKAMVVAGCLVKARPGLVARSAPGASMLAPQAVYYVIDAVDSALRGDGLVKLEGARDTSWMPTPPLMDRVATLMIQEGCLGDCSFCISKLARRQVKSFHPRIIVEKVGELVRRGAREVRLTGLDVAVYGVDLPGKPTLADLIAMILDKVPGDYRIRVGMMTPDQAADFIDDLLDVYRDERVYKYFHLPVQSGDDEVLKLMNRRYSVKEYKELHRKIKSRYPDAMIATDIIVGHPGETEEAFMNTVRLVEELRFEKVHLAQYSIRPHTKAAAMPQVPDNVKKRRSSYLMKIIERIGLEINSRYVGKKVKAIAVEKGFREGSLVARLDNYVPVVIPFDPALLGKKIEAVVREATFFDLRGEVVGVVD